MNFLFVDYENGTFCEFCNYHYSKQNNKEEDHFIGCVTRRKGNIPMISEEIVRWANVIIVTSEYFKKTLLFSFPTYDDKLNQDLYNKTYSISVAEYKGSHYDSSREEWEANVIAKVDRVIEQVKHNLSTS